MLGKNSPALIITEEEFGIVKESPLIVKDYKIREDANEMIKAVRKFEAALFYRERGLEYFEEESRELEMIMNERDGRIIAEKFLEFYKKRKDEIYLEDLKNLAIYALVYPKYAKELKELLKKRILSSYLASERFK